ncbi:MAG: hypothetical protein IJG64_02635 [Oscillospiraceae bacterium]|nr:hypothetical protein [Oscillospiraceae bacterium]
MNKTLVLVLTLFIALFAFASCVKSPDSSSRPDVISEQNNENMEYEDPGIDPELAGRDLQDGDEITYAPEKEAILSAMKMAINDLWTRDEFEDPAKFTEGFRSPIPPEGMEKPDLKSIDDIKVIYSTKNGEAYVGYYHFQLDGRDWTMIAEYSMEKGSFTIPGTISFVKGNI